MTLRSFVVFSMYVMFAGVLSFFFAPIIPWKDSEPFWYYLFASAIFLVLMISPALLCLSVKKDSNNERK